MESADESEIISICSKFLRDAPPGEINDVYNDLRELVDNSILQKGLNDAFTQHNCEQLISVKHPKGHEVILCPETMLEDGRFLDPKSQTAITVDHMRLTVSKADPIPPHLDAKVSEFREYIESAVITYVENYFPTGVSVVVANDSTISIHISGNKSGRWRTSVQFSVETFELRGLTRVQVHYYEDGNVQLNSSKDFSLKLDGEKPSAVSDAIVGQLLKNDAEFQTSLNNSFSDVSVSTFKALRRALPITRTKIDWNAILSYKVGAELSK